ncbi:MAG TPA: hypothetical protein VHM31_17165 [Polyangia bacterium]|nr:hypothetical protein [Polyangia bacterium]
MLSTLFTIAALLAGPGLASGGQVRWEKVYEAAGPDEFVAAVWAVDRDEWFAAGKWGVTHVTKAGQQSRGTRSTVAGLFGESAKSVFALGYDQLVLHFDGRAWAEEHDVPTPKRRPRDYDNLVHSAFYAPGDPHGTLMAFGPHAVLQRRPDGTWRAPAEPERERLSALAEHGPADNPAGCRRERWFWLGKDLAWFVCQDGRTFIFDRGQATPKGRMPRSCSTPTRAAYATGEIYVACSERGVWRTNDQTWRRLPRFEGDARAFDISVAGGCVFVTARRAVWRRCEP